MFSKILLLPSKTGTSDRSIRYAVKLFPSSGFHIMSVVFSSDGQDIPGKLYYGVIKDISGEILERARKIISGYDMDIKNNFVEGETPNDILEYIEKEDIDLLVLPVRERDDSFKARINKHDENIIKKVDIPILTLNSGSATRKPKYILNPTDGLAHSFMATELSLLLASHFGAKIDMIFMGKSRQRHKKAMKWAKEEAQKLKISLTSEGGSGNQFSADGILGPVDSKKYDLIVIGKGKGLMHSDHLGMISREVIASSSIPVLTVGE